MEKLLEQLTRIDAVSGFEFRGNKELASIFSKFLEEVETDANGNVYGFLRCGRENAPLVMLEAHLDVIGLMVKDIDERGFVSVVAIGGVDPRILAGAEVMIHGKKDIYGVLGVKPPHILTDQEMKAGMELSGLAVDTGLTKEELEPLVAIGTPVQICTPHRKIGEDKFCGAGLDDRAGITAILMAAHMLARTNLRFDICILAAGTEETGRYGAQTGTYTVKPDLAIIVDVTHGETPDGDPERTNPLGKGPVFCYGPNLSRRYTDQMIEITETNHIPYQIEVEEGDPGTDAWMVQMAHEGVPCLMASIPLRYMHTTVETLSIKDLENTARAIFEFLKRAEVE